jgi:glycine dehydrogenase subunit 1
MTRHGDPWIPNANPAIAADMLRRIGVDDHAALYAAIPEALRVDGLHGLPAAVASEAALEREIADLLARDPDPAGLLCFLGGGCAPHYTPALTEEIVRRAEFATSYWGNVYSDHGKYQAFFEYASLLGEILDMDATCLPTYDHGNAAAVGLRMACRVAGRPKAVLASAIGPDRSAIIAGYLAPDIEVVQVPWNPGTGTVDLDALAAALDETVGAVHLESPTYLGGIETAAAEVADAAHAVGALVVGGCDPSSLGVLAPPAAYGADIACGDLQPLGIPMHYGGGLSGFLATRDEERLVQEYPTFLIGRTDTSVPGEHGFGLVAWNRTSYMRREEGKDFGGTTTGLWAIGAAVTLALLGPTGLRELGEGILQRRAYAEQRLAGVDGVRVLAPGAARFKEIPIAYEGRSVADVNRHLLERGILGGHDLGAWDPSLDGAALVCVTERHTKGDIDRLVEATAEALAR